MTGHSARLPRLRLTLRQMMKLVIFAAIASASVSDCLAQAGLVSLLPSWSTVYLWGDVVVPLVSALVAFPLVRKGPLKDWLIRSLLMTSVAVALGLAIYWMGYVCFSVRRWHSIRFTDSNDVAGVIVVGHWCSLSCWRVIPGWCQTVSRRYSSRCFEPQSGIRDGDIGVPCDGRYWKLHGTCRPLPPNAAPRTQ